MSNSVAHFPVSDGSGFLVISKERGGAPGLFKDVFQPTSNSKNTYRRILQTYDKLIDMSSFVFLFILIRELTENGNYT